MLNIDKFPYDEMNEELMFGFKKKLVNKFQSGGEKESKASKNLKLEHMKDPYKNFGSKSDKTKKPNPEEDEEEKK